MKPLTAEQKLKVLNREGYNVDRINKRLGVTYSLERVNKDIKIINKHYLHKDSLCKECKNKLKWQNK